MDRRAFLGALGTTGLLTVAGCSTLGSTATAAFSVPEVRLYNWTEGAAEFELVVSDETQVYYWDSHTVSGQSETLLTEFFPEPAQYTVLARVADATPRKVTTDWVLSTHDPEFVDPPSVALEFDLHVDGTFSKDAELLP